MCFGKSLVWCDFCAVTFDYANLFDEWAIGAFAESSANSRLERSCDDYLCRVGDQGIC